jgi:triose/dihydroxyacetone kinase / FAD-AMP lyase (cyclizing)
MPGFSLTLLLLPRPNAGAPNSTSEILGLLDARPEAPGWKWNSASVPVVMASVSVQPDSSNPPASCVGQTSQSHKFLEIIERACVSLIQAEPEITRLDSIAGDGDCGLTLKGGAEGAPFPLYHKAN